MKITLCGSTRFMQQFHEANVALTLAGHVVYSVATPSHNDLNPEPNQKVILDLVHLKKILDSDVIVLVGVEEDGSTYLGQSTTREVAWGLMLEKRFCFWGHPEQRKRILQGPDSIPETLENFRLMAAETNAIREAREKETQENLKTFLSNGSPQVFPPN